MFDRTLLDNPAALLAYFVQWYANADGELFSPQGEPVDLHKWSPTRVTISSGKELVAILAEQRQYQRADIYDVAAERFVCMREASLYDAQPIFDLRFRTEPGRIDFVFAEFEETEPAQRKFWPGGYVVSRGEWIMPDESELDRVAARSVSTAALARHPGFNVRNRRPRLLSGPAADFGVHYSFELDAETNDFFGYVSVHDDVADYVARVDGRSGELLWKAAMASYDNYQRIGNWVVTNAGVYRASDGTQVCKFDGDPEFVPMEHRVLLAPDESLWLAVNPSEVPGQYLRALPVSGEVQTLQLDYQRLIQSQALWLGCTQDENGLITLHGIPTPTSSELAPPIWSGTPPTDIGQAVFEHYFCTERSLNERYIVGVENTSWWILELATGKTWAGTLDDGHSWHSLHCIDDERAYFSAGVDDQQKIYWLDLNTREIGVVPLEKGDWRSINVKENVIYAIENWGANMVTRHVPAAYDLKTGERLWEGVHTRLCTLIFPTRLGIAVGGPIGVLYLFEP